VENDVVWRKQVKLCWKLLSRNDDFSGLVICNARKILEEHTGFLLKKEIDVDHALPGRQCLERHRTDRHGE